ncbi:MAG: hypothetical protein NVV62_10730 [Terricaulis sp.]|nr:hypothetical protein [Terricaulis sp.]
MTSDNTWVLRGVDAEARQAALEEAERQGLSLSDFLTAVLAGEAGLAAAPEGAPPEAEPEPAYPAPRPTRENNAFRHRVEALERQLTASLGGLDGALKALDSTVLSFSAQLDETGALAEDSATALTELQSDVAMLRKRLAAAEQAAGALADSGAEARHSLLDRCEALEAHLQSVESIAYAADATGARLATAQEALTRALAQDFEEFSAENARRFEAASKDMRALSAQTDARLAAAQEALRQTFTQDFNALSQENARQLSAAREAMRADADDAADQAEAAAQRAIEALRQSRAAMEQALADQAEETRAVVHGAFVDAVERIEALADRVHDQQHAAHRATEQLSARLNGIEDAAQMAVEETAAQLRAADSALAADLARARQDAATAAAALGERQNQIAQHISRVDHALNDALLDIEALREDSKASLSDSELVIVARQDAFEGDVRARIDDLIARLDRDAEAAAAGAHANAANIERVEASVFASLQKLAHDIVSNNTAQTARHEETLKRAQAGVDRVAQRQDTVEGWLTQVDKALLAQAATNTDADARLDRLERNAEDASTQRALAALAEDMNARLGQLEQGAADSSTEEALNALAKEIGLISARIEETDAPAQFAALNARLEDHNAQLTAAAERSQDVSRTLARVAAQNEDAAVQLDERMSRLEEEAQHNALAAAEEIAARIRSMDQRHTDALEALRAEIAHFLAENELRLHQIERTETAVLTGDELLIARAIEARLTELEQRDVAAEFDALRRRIETRIGDVERSSVRALEQMANTIELIEKRYAEGEDTISRSA